MKNSFVVSIIRETQPMDFFNWAYPGLMFSLFWSFQYRWQNIGNINLANDWIRTADHWCRMRPLYQLSHNHCPKVQKSVSIRFRLSDRLLENFEIKIIKWQFGHFAGRKWYARLITVWPYVAIKMAKVSTKVAQRRSHSSFHFTSYVFQNRPKSHQIPIWATFEEKCVTKNFQNTPNPVTLVTSANDVVQEWNEETNCLVFVKRFDDGKRECYCF